MPDAIFRGGTPTMVPYTPSGESLAQGQIKVLNSRCLVAHDAIADGVPGVLSAPNGAAFYELPKPTTAAALTLEQPMYWATSGNTLSTNSSLPFVGRVHSGTMTVGAGTTVIRNAEA
jgi:hypothetical protein